MSQILNKLKNSENRLYYFGLIALFGCLSCYLWLYGTQFIAGIMDISYHVSTASSFARAGGVSGWDFWESLPVGRAHNYPPLFHIILANFIKAGIPISVCIKLMLELVIAGGLMVYTLGIKRLLGIKVAFWSVFFLALSRTFLNYSATMMPSALAILLTPLLIYFLREQRWVSYTILLMLILYTHLFLPYAILLAIIFYICIWQRELFWPAAKATLVAFLAYFPWLIHVIVGGFDYIKYFDSSYPLDILRGYCSINLIVLFLAALSFSRVFKINPDRSKLAPLFSLLVAFLVVSIFAMSRALGSFVMFPLAALAGYSVVNFWKKKFLILPIIIMIMIYPVRVIYFTNSVGHFTFLTEKSLLSGLREDAQKHDQRTFFEKYASLFELVDQNSAEGQSIASAASNFDARTHNFTKIYQFSITNFIGGGASRPSLNSRMPEIYHREPPDLSKAKILFLNSSLHSLSAGYFRDFGYKPMNQSTIEMTGNIKKNFEQIAVYPALDHQDFYVYKNLSNDVIKENKPKLVFSLYLADAAIIIFVLILLFDRKRGLHARKSQV